MHRCSCSVARLPVFVLRASVVSIVTGVRFDASLLESDASSDSALSLVGSGSSARTGIDDSLQVTQADALVQTDMEHQDVTQNISSVRVVSESLVQDTQNLSQMQLSSVDSQQLGSSAKVASGNLQAQASSAAEAISDSVQDQEQGALSVQAAADDTHHTEQDSSSEQAAFGQTEQIASSSAQVAFGSVQQQEHASSSSGVGLVASSAIVSSGNLQQKPRSSSSLSTQAASGIARRGLQAASSVQVAPSLVQQNKLAVVSAPVPSGHVKSSAKPSTSGNLLQRKQSPSTVQKSGGAGGKTEQAPSLVHNTVELHGKYGEALAPIRMMSASLHHSKQVNVTGVASSFRTSNVSGFAPSVIQKDGRASGTIEHASTTTHRSIAHAGSIVNTSSSAVKALHKTEERNALPKIEASSETHSERASDGIGEGFVAESLEQSDSSGSSATETEDYEAAFVASDDEPFFGGAFEGDWDGDFTADMHGHFTGDFRGHFDSLHGGRHNSA